MADECCNSFGGIMSISVNGARLAQTQADITLDVSNIEVTAEANQDGSAAYMSKPKLYGADIAPRLPCDIDFDALMRQCAVDVTIKEETNKRTHIFNQARIVGSPKVNLTSGVIEGLRVEGSRYKRITV